MNRIVEKLRSNGITDDLVFQRLGELWGVAVGAITDERVKAAVIYLLEEEVAWQFFAAPASSSGKFHPSWQCTPGGLARHTTEMCVGLRRHIQQFPELTDGNCAPLSKSLDTLLAAVALHDAYKNGLPWGEKTDYLDHHRLASEKWKGAAERLKVPKDILENAAEAIFWHAGRWTPGWTLEIDKKLGVYARVVHTMDMVFSDMNLDRLFEAKSLQLPLRRS